MSRRLILIRHGQTTYNSTGRMQGHLDTELSELGYEQARAAARLLQDQGVSKIVASDLLRARETARVVAEALGMDFTTDARLRETHLGQWQGRTSAEVDTEFPGARAIWRHDPLGPRRRANPAWTWPSVPGLSSTSSWLTSTVGKQAPSSSWPMAALSRR